MDSYLIVADQRNTRLQLAGGIDRVAVDGDEREAAFLIEAQRVEIVVCGNQPEPFAACLAGCLRDCLDQSRTDTNPRLRAIKRHDLAVFTFKRVCKQAYSLPAQDGDEAGQHMWMVDLAVSNDDGRAPIFADTLLHPRAIFGSERPHFQRKAFAGAMGMTVIGVDGLGSDMKVDAFAPLAGLCMCRCVEKILQRLEVRVVRRDDGR